jgi:coenzyme F420-reducing hydrogenase beta subunit
MFTALSDLVLARGGVVFGAAFDQHLNVVHLEAATPAERDRLRGSKYVQSDLSDSFPRVAALLKSGREVLFSGTPCQTAGLAAFLEGQDRAGLLLCDIVCHGTPSPLIWREHLTNLERSHRSRAVAYQCRAKDRGWHGHLEKVTFEDGRSDCRSRASQSYKDLFYAHLMLRPACHECRYTSFQRTSDLTIADFWGIERTLADFDDNRGTSLVLVNTPKGQAAFEAVQGQLRTRVSTTKDCLQPQLQHPSRPAPLRARFWQDYHARGYRFVLDHYAGLSPMRRLRRAAGLGLQSLGLLKLVKKLLGRG